MWRCRSARILTRRALPTRAGPLRGSSDFSSRSPVAKGSRFRSAARPDSGWKQRRHWGGRWTRRASPGGDRPGGGRRRRPPVCRSRAGNVAGAAGTPGSRARIRRCRGLPGPGSRLGFPGGSGGAAHDCGKTRPRPAGPRAGDRSGRRGWLPRPRRVAGALPASAARSSRRTLPDALPTELDSASPGATRIRRRDHQVGLAPGTRHDRARLPGRRGQELVALITAEFETFARQETPPFVERTGQARDATRATLLFQITPQGRRLPPVMPGLVRSFRRANSDGPASSKHRGGLTCSVRLSQ